MSAKPKKILIYSANFAPEQTGIGKYSGEMAAWLAARGHEVRVVAAPPYYPQWRVDSDYPWRPFRSDLWRGVRIWRAPLWVPKAPRGRARILHLMSFAVTSLPLMLAQVFWRPDVVVTVAPAFVCAPGGWLTARLSGARAWLHLQDFEIDLAFALGLLKNQFMKRVIVKLERWIMRRFDSVSSISGKMVAHLIDKGVAPERTEYFPNWVDVSHVNPALRASLYRAELGIAKDAVVVLFSGSMGGKQGLHVIPEIATVLAARTDIVFIVCGDGVMKPIMEAASAQLPNLKVLPLQPFERLGELLCLADIHLLPQSAEASDFVLPSKLSGMLASGRPIVSTAHPATELGDVVSQCGTIVPAGDACALATAVLRLAEDASLRAELGRCGRDFAETHFEMHGVLARRFGALEPDTVAVQVAPDVAEDGKALGDVMV
jgi:colanic acid biosynthesis glycosyl transferase WcaI